MRRFIHKVRRKLLDKVMGLLLPHGYYYAQRGTCLCCDKKVLFQALNPWLRDSWICPHCKSKPRERGLMLALNRFYPAWRELTIHECSPGRRGASVKLKRQCKGYVPSQYFPQHEFGTMVDGFQNQNLEQQTFANESFDLVITQDVMEHIYNPAAAFAEIARTLKPGGAHVFTVPAVNKHAPTVRWATMNADGSPNFLHEAEYHGNPVDRKGSPVTMHWGFDIVSFIRDCCGMETQILDFYEPELALGGEYNEVYISVKK